MQKEDVKIRIKNLSNQIDMLPRDDISNIVMFLENNELGVALDTLCNQIYDNNIKISLHIYKSIEEIGNEMRMYDSNWTFLTKLIDESL